MEPFREQVTTWRAAGIQGTTSHQPPGADPQPSGHHTLSVAGATQLCGSNLDFSEWGDAFPNRLPGTATLDRLRHGAYRVVLDGES